MLFAIDESLTLADPYFERRLPTTSLEPVADYADPDVIVTGTTHEWNHGLGEVVTALLDAGLTITGLTEHDSIPWDAFPGQMTELDGGNEFQLTDRPKRLAHSYTLRATRN